MSRSTRRSQPFAKRASAAIIVRPLTIAHNGVRASIPFFLLEEEIDLLAAAVRNLAESRR